MTKIDFTSIRARINYCEIEIENLFVNFKNALPGIVSIEEKVRDDSRILERFLNIKQNSVYNYPMKLSEIVHHLRSTLDNLIYLVASNEAILDENEVKRLYFPIIENEIDWSSNATRKIFKEKCQNKYYQLLLHLQPFTSNIAWEDSHLKPLTTLNKYSVEDKHRRLRLVFVKVNDLDFAVGFRFQSDSDACIPRGEIFGEAFRAGGLIQRFELDNRFESYESKTKIACELWVEGIDMPAQKFLSDCLTVVKTIADNFERIGEDADWNSSFIES